MRDTPLRSTIRLAESAFIPVKNSERTQRQLTRDRVSAGFSGCGRKFGFGAVGRVLLVDDLSHLEQLIAWGIGGDPVGEPVIRPIERADAASLAKLELRLASEIDHKVITAEPGTFTVLVHEQCGGPVVGGWQPSPPQPEAQRAQIGNDQPVAEALRQPLHEMGFFVGAYLDRVASFDRKG